jgi:hypothetical protein
MKMNKLAQNWVLIVSLALLSLPCVSVGAPQNESGQTKASSHTITILNHGYAMLNNKAKELSNIHNLLRVKVQTKAVGDIMDELSQYGDKMQKQLKGMTKRYPSLSLEHTGLPEIEVKKRKAVSDYFLKKMLPLVGRTGRAFDRTILQTQLQILNQTRFYVRELIDEEHNQNRKHMLKGMKKHLDHLYKQVFDLLNKEYYRT